MSRAAFPGQLEYVLACTQQFDDGERQIGKGRRIGLAALAEEGIQRAGIGCRRQPLTQACGQRYDALPSLGLAQHAAQRREALALEELRGHAIRGDHEMLDDLLRPIPLVRPQVAQHCAVEHRLGLDRLEAQRAVLVSRALQRLRDPVLEAKVLVHPRRGLQGCRGRPPALQPCRNAVIGELGPIDDNCLIQIRRRHRASGADRHFDDQAQAFLPLA